MNLDKLRTIKTVYSYLLPEVRKIITDLTQEYPHEVFLSSVQTDGFYKTKEGGLDNFHEGIIQKLVTQHDICHLRGFQFSYPTAGSQEGIREFMTMLQSQQSNQPVYVFKGEYEGFRETAYTRNLPVIEVDLNVQPADLYPGTWFISDPSAITGCHLPPDIVHRICESGHQVFYDLSYAGSTEPYLHDLNHPNIVAATVSFSKPYGLFYYRIGFTFSRVEIPSLFANKWFKNIFGLLIADRILDQIDPKTMAEKYKKIQKIALDRIFQETGLELNASDSFLLAHLAEDNRFRFIQTLQPFKRQGSQFYRFCLTPYLLELEKEMSELFF